MLTPLLAVLSSLCVGARKSEPSVGDGGAGLFRGSDTYDFAVMVPAARTECFWHFAHQSGNFYLTYMVQWTTGVGTDPRLLVTLSSPQGALLASKSGASAHMNARTDVTGFYRMCLGNHNNRFGSVRVSVSFGVIYEGLEEWQREVEKEEELLNGTLTGIEESVQRLHNNVLHMWRHYNFARMRRGKDHDLLLSNLSYVTWWSAAQTLLIILCGNMQLLALRRLFPAGSGRGRC